MPFLAFFVLVVSILLFSQAISLVPGDELQSDMQQDDTRSAKKVKERTMPHSVRYHGHLQGPDNVA